MARREEKVDAELLARLESGGSDKIRVPLPNRKVNEMFAIADQILGGRRVRAVCEDGDSRLARIPGKMRRRQWVREGDLIVVQPWDFQDEKANVVMRYTKTQSLYLSRKGVLPDIVDLFGMSEDISEVTDSNEELEIIEEENLVEEESELEVEEPVVKDTTSVDDDIDSFFG
ncbi:MAG: translation initiation factor eIF-1A [Euryarchaeota archaeon]|jgi:translation initiation factor 1A|nr:translation initiation factor eIF-1A [Euryarchaeota archaeon]MAP65581.1 translation initiation factor eIF-1A [Euryarchaeota archaeon]MBF71578.1 translation initiation factor eIF-1A [Euryarchaeota archaeon]MDP6292713.1 translation initiation factor eIF-1A [Candidatus Thalassarchaeaceae archaeon]|tara:strand:- start:648 stop:1163 length:516 start_codon:yes stop_codon:yes gene_type:complete